MDIKPGPLLSQINVPADLKKLSLAELSQLAAELRQYIIDLVSTYGGHFAGSLGVVELTVALHYVFNAPYDQIVWDVGHQAYGHKILTSRRDQFVTNRQFGGISGFPKRSESEYDSFGVGHSSTSISAALGIAMASYYKGKRNRQHIAIIGDGALSAGLAFEGLNNAGSTKSNLLVVLNDNSISIDPNTSALEKYLKEVGGSEVREDKGCKNLFEDFGLQYFGPIDGHSISGLTAIFNKLKSIDGAKLLHIKTVKGKGYVPAETNQPAWHATGAFDKITGKVNNPLPGIAHPQRYQDVFGETILELAKKNDKIIGITPAMPSGSGLKIMMDEMPGRAFDVGINEQHAVTVSAGMATQGLKVFCNIYSTFMQRAYDQVIHDVALQDLPVVFCLDRAGLVGEDGPTHHGVFDLAYMRCVPNMIVSAPMNEAELRNLMYTAQLDKTNHPFSIRYPRGRGALIDWRKPFEEIEIGTGRTLREGEEVAVLTIGHPGNFAAEAINIVRGEGLNPAHYDMRFVKPLDEKLLHEVFSRFSKIITVEDGTIRGGFGSVVLEWMNEQHYSATIKILGIPDKFIEQGSLSELRRLAGIDTKSIANAIRELL